MGDVYADTYVAVEAYVAADAYVAVDADVAVDKSKYETSAASVSTFYFLRFTFCLLRFTFCLLTCRLPSTLHLLPFTVYPVQDALLARSETRAPRTPPTARPETRAPMPCKLPDTTRLRPVGRCLPRAQRRTGMNLRQRHLQVTQSSKAKEKAKSVGRK